MSERITPNGEPKSNPKGKGKMNQQKRKGKRNVDTNQRTSRDDSGGRQYGDVNDANYYFLDDTVKSQITNISFNQYVGVPFEIYQNGTTHVAAETPSIMVMHMNPAAGTGNNSGSVTGINLAALNTYTKLSASNAKTTNYAPQDITMLILALGEVISMSSHLARAFGAARIYNMRNRAYPKRIVEAMGVDYDDLIANFADYKTYYNSLMTVLSSIPIPDNIPYLHKCAEIYSYIYLDMEGSSMAQSYAFIPYSTWIMQEATADTGTILKTANVHSLGGTFSTMSTLLTVLDNMIQALLQSTTLNYIYSDILRLADKEGLSLLKFSTLPEDYVVVPVYNPEIRKWINNAVFTGDPKAAIGGHTDYNDVVSDPDRNIIKYNPTFPGVVAGQIKPIMNFDTGFPTVDDIVDATRLMAAVEVGSDKIPTSVALPDHYVVGAKVFYSTTSIRINSNVQLDTTIAGVAAALSNFDWAPYIYLYDSNGVISDYIGDVNYFTTVDMDYLERLFDMSYQALFSMR